MLEIARGYFEKIDYQKNKFVISGWMLLPQKKFDSFAIYINQHKMGVAAPIEREDVAKAYPFIYHAKNSGFMFIFNNHPEDIKGMLDIYVIGISKGIEIAKMETWYRTDLDSFPYPPPDLILRTAGHKNPHFFTMTGLQTYREFWLSICKYADVYSIKSMLDWGCGCGRVIVHFLKYSGIPKIFGCDIDKEAINWCQNNLKQADFSVIPLYPPTTYNNNTFDLIVSYSVMTHLAKEVQISWLKEMQRILAFGGLFLTTVHGKFATFFNFQGKEINDVLKNGIIDIDDPALKNIAPEGYYRGTYQTKEYTFKEYSHFFEILEYKERGGGNYQDFIIMRKPMRK